MKLIAFIIGWLILFGIGGCKSVEQNQNVLRFLQEAKARGHAVIVSDGALSVGATTEFYAGAKKMSVSFDGDIDFADSVRHVTPPAE